MIFEVHVSSKTNSKAHDTMHKKIKTFSGLLWKQYLVYLQLLKRFQL